MSYTDTISKVHNDNTLIPSDYKKTAIGIIPTDWEVKKLKDLCFNKGEYGINAAAVDFSEDLPVYLRITDIDDDGYFSSSKKCSVDDINSSNFYLNKNDIVFVRTGAATGKAYLYNERGGILVYAGFLIRFKIDINKANDYFLWSFTQSKPYWDWVKTVCTRSGQPGINSTEYASIQLPIPPLPEQQKIAEILSTWDEAIGNCKNTISTLNLRNNGLSQQLLTGKKRLSGFSEKWIEQKIKDFSIEVSLKNKTDEDIIVLSCTKHNGLVPSLEYFGRKIYSDNLKTYKIVEKNVFAYATNHIEEGSIGYQSKYEKALISPMYTVFKTDEDINDQFLFRVLKSNTYIQEYQKRMEGSIDRRGGLRWQGFSKIKVSVPSYEEQTAIAQVLDTAYQELKSYEAKLEALQLQKKGLMQQLLTGKTRVNVK